MPDQSALNAALRAVLPPGVALGVADPLSDGLGLLPGERLPGALPARVKEFAAGRRAAREAMAALGVGPAPIPHRRDRAPGWPLGVTGSISHSGRVCLAVMGRSEAWTGLGLDVEGDHPLDAALWSDVLRPEEHAMLDRLPESERGRAAMTVFVAKEAAYKAQYGSSQTLFGFDTLRVTLTASDFSARFMNAVPGFAEGTMIHGTICRADGHVAAFCAIRRPEGV